MTENKDELREHAYDGILEYDNPLPGWWKWSFIATILMSPIYWVYFHGGGNERSVTAGYDKAVADNLRLQFAEIGELKPDRETMVKYMHEPKWLKVGDVVFKANCVSCHGQNGEGKIGPNLADEHWKNVNHIEDIAGVVIRGAANNAMPAWANRLHPNEVVLVSAYVASMRGTAIAQSGKGPEGKVIPPWPELPNAINEIN